MKCLHSIKTAQETLSIHDQPQNHILVQRILLLALALFCFVLSGCATTSSRNSDVPLATAMVPSEGKSLVYVFADINRLDSSLSNKKYMLEFERPKSDAVGELTNENYYVFEVWPGKYTLRKQLPHFKFFGMSAGGHEAARAKINVPEPNLVLAFSFNSGSGTRYTLWKDRAAEFSGRKMAGYYSANETSFAFKFNGGTWEGPSKGIYQHGVGVARLNDGSVYRGRMENGKMTADGRLEYPNGTFYMGEYGYGNEPSGMGLLADKDENIIYSGKFSSGKPSGGGATIKDGQVTFIKYDYNGNKLESNPEKVAEQRVLRNDKIAIQLIARTAKPIASQINDLEEYQSNRRSEFEAQEDEYPKRCHCVLVVGGCVYLYSGSPSSEEREAMRKRDEEKEKACRKWAASGGSQAERRAELDRSLAANDKKLKTLVSKYKAAEKRDAEKRKRKAAELQATEKARKAAIKKQIEAQQAQNLENQKQACASRMNSCGCYAFRPPRGPNESLACEK